MKKLFTLVFVALLSSVLSAGIKKTIYRDYGIVVFHPDSLISVRAHQIVWGNFWVIQSDSTDTMSMTPDVFTIDTVIINDYLYSTDDVRFDSTLYFTDGGADTSSIVQDGTNLKFASDNPFAMSRQLTFVEDVDRTGEGTILFANAIPIGMTTPGDCQGMKTEFKYGVAPTLTGGGKVIQGLMLKMTMDQRWKFASANRNADVRGIGVQAELNDSLGGVLEAIYANAYTDIATDKQIIGEHTTGAYGVGMCAIEARTEIKGAGALTVPHIAGLYVLHRRMGTGGVTGDYHAIHIENSQGTGAISGTETAIHFEPNTMAPPGANFDYGIDMEPVAFGTADVRLSSGATVRNPADDTLIFTEANIKYSGKLLSDGNMWMQSDTMFFTDGGADTTYIVQDGTYLVIDGDNSIYMKDHVYLNGNLYLSGNASEIQTYGNAIKIGADNNAQMVFLSFNNEDSIKVDTTGSTGHRLSWTGAGGMEIRDGTGADTSRWYDDGSSTIFLTDNDFVLSDDVTLGDTINTVFLPKGTRLILADSSGADSSIIYNDGINLTFTSDNKIRFLQNIWFSAGDTIFLVDASGADTNWIVNDGTVVKFSGDNSFQINQSLVCAGDLDGTNDASAFTWHGRKWYIDYDEDDSLAIINWFGTTDSLMADTISHQLTWTGAGGIKAKGAVIDDGNLIVADGQHLIVTDGTEADSFELYDTGLAATISSDNPLIIMSNLLCENDAKMDTLLLPILTTSKTAPSGYGTCFIDTVGTDSLIIILDSGVRRGIPIE